MQREQCCTLKGGLPVGSSGGGGAKEYFLIRRPSLPCGGSDRSRGGDAAGPGSFRGKKDLHGGETLAIFSEGCTKPFILLKQEPPEGGLRRAQKKRRAAKSIANAQQGPPEDDWSTYERGNPHSLANRRK